MGKTVACVNDLIAKAVHTKKKNARYAYIAPLYKQAKDVAWQYLKEGTENIATKIRESDLRVILPNNSWITLYGADNPDALRGLYFDGVVLDEFGDCRPSLWAEVVLPTLMDRRGWAVFIGTPKGKNHFYHINERAKKEDSWFQMTAKASETGLLDADDLKEMRGQMTEDQYAQEMECSFEAAVEGTYYADIIHKMESNLRISSEAALYDPIYPVTVSADLGYTDSSAWWFWQTTPQGIQVIDYYEASGESVAHYIDMLNGRSYEYEMIWLPHDAKAKSFQTGKSTVEQFLGGGWPTDVVPKLAVQHGIDAVRKVLPEVWINQVKCFEGIEALRAYKRKYNDKTQAFSRTPEHNWASNGADSFRYLCLVCGGHLPSQTQEHIVQPIIKPPEYRLDELFEERERGSRSGIIRI